MKTYVTTKGEVKEQQLNGKIQDIATASKLDTEDLVHVKVEVGVLGNRSGVTKTSGDQQKGGLATGSSLRRGLKSGYKTANYSVPFKMAYVDKMIEVLVLIIACIQNKLSKILRDAQGQVDGSLRQSLKDTAMRTEAITLAKDELMNRTSEQFDQQDFDYANRDIRAKVLYDMHMTGKVEINFSIPVEHTEKADWARAKGYRLDQTGSYYTMFATEKGLKSVYLISASQVSAAQKKVDEIAEKVESILPEVTKLSTLGEDNSKKVLELINKALDYPEQNIDEILIDEYTEEEKTQIRQWADDIIEAYDTKRNALTI